MFPILIEKALCRWWLNKVPKGFFQMFLACLGDQPFSLIHIITTKKIFRKTLLNKNIALHSLKINDESIQPNFSLSQRLSDKLVLSLLRSTSFNLLCHELEKGNSFILFKHTGRQTRARIFLPPWDRRRVESFQLCSNSPLQFFILNALNMSGKAAFSSPTAQR